MERKKVGTGIIGCGTISDVYLTNIKEHYDNLQLIACEDLFVEKANQMKQK